MGKKEFDYYLFIDYSVDYLGYLIIEKERIKDFLPQVSKFAHYRELKNKKAYINSIRKVVIKNNVCDYLYRIKIKKTEFTPEIYVDILDSLKKHDSSLIFICVDDKQFKNFNKIVHIIDGKNTTVIKEGKLKKYTPEYKINLVLDTLLNLARVKNDKF